MASLTFCRTSLIKSSHNSQQMLDSFCHITESSGLQKNKGPKHTHVGQPCFGILCTNTYVQWFDLWLPYIEKQGLLCEKTIAPLTSNFSFSAVFSTHLENFLPFSSNLKFVVYKLFEFGICRLGKG